MSNTVEASDVINKLAEQIAELSKKVAILEVMLATAQANDQPVTES